MIVHVGIKYPCGQCGKHFLIREILLNIKGQYMKESNTLAGNVANNFLIRDMLLNIKGWHMKESNTLVGNVIKNFLQRRVLPDTRKLCIKLNKN